MYFKFIWIGNRMLPHYTKAHFVPVFIIKILDSDFTMMLYQKQNQTPPDVSSFPLTTSKRISDYKKKKNPTF